MCQGTVKCYLESIDRLRSQISPTWCPTTPTAGRNTPVNLLRRRLKITRDNALKAQINRLLWSVTNQLNDWRNDHWSNTLESLDLDDKAVWKMTRRVKRIPTAPLPLVTPWKLALSGSEKAEARADMMEV